MISYDVLHDAALVELRSPPVNAISFALLDELCAAVRRANEDDRVRGIVITGGTEHFSAGADLAIFQGIARDEDARHASRVFQDGFQAIEDSPKPVIAALAGHVLGGALELAMACHLRVAAEGSRYSMPEVNLGINPGAGGTQRLPRLAGIEAALEMLLSGRSIDARRALDLGLITAICPAERLRETAAGLLTSTSSKTRLRTDKLGDTAAIHAALSRAEAQVAALRTELVAPRQILAAVRAGVTETFEAGLLAEQEAFRQCMASLATQNKIYLFCASRHTARVPGPPPLPADRIDDAGVLGMGTMGAGIAQALVMAGVRVTVCDQREDALTKGTERIRTSLERRVAQGKLAAAKVQATLARLTTSLDWQSLAGMPLVVEAVFEDIDVKGSAIARLEEVCSPKTIIATNTSTINLDTLALGMKHPERLIGLHFFHPAQQMPLVEVIRRRMTPPQLVTQVLGFMKAVGKTPILVENREGFVVNRLFIPYLTEAFWLLEEGVDPAQIDRAMVDFGFAMGPLQLIDMSGLDILVKAQAIMRAAFPHHGSLSAIVHQLCDAGHLGQKTGAGVYRYEAGDRTPQPHLAADQAIATARQQRGASVKPEPSQIVERLVLRMVAEAFALLEEGVVQRPEDIDVAMVLGAGLADFRGGVVKYAQDCGLDRVVQQLRRLEQQCGPRYAPCRLLEQRMIEENHQSLTG